ncbi:MAG: lytic transglycosylase domain-containing protein [Reichenbachiella sp.]
MMPVKVKYSIIGALIGGAIVFSAGLFSNTEVNNEDRNVTLLPEKQNNGKITGYKAPGSISFAGEEVPLHRADVLEKLEREVMVNAFWHSNSVILIKRANKYLPTIDSILVANDIPADFKYLAVAESGLDNVISPARAVGFWQFLKGTARDFGLVVNKDIDQRYDPFLATVAATKYLKEAHEKFGNWTTVAASYNLGMTGAKKIIEAQKSDTYYDMIMSEEPSRYVFRVLALKNMLENPSNYGFDIPTEEKYFLPKTKSVEISKSIVDLHEFAKTNNVSYYQLRYLNPWIRNYQLPVRPGQKFEIKLPIE